MLCSRYHIKLFKFRSDLFPHLGKKRSKHRDVKGAIAIPQRATFDTLDKRYVFVVGDDGAVHQRKIHIQHPLHLSALSTYDNRFYRRQYEAATDPHRGSANARPR